MKKFQKNFIIIIAISFGMVQSSFADVFDQMRGGFTEKSECPVLFKMGKWEYGVIKGGGEYWGREQSWFGPDGLITETGTSFDFNTESGISRKEKSYEIMKDSKWTITYIGPWKKVILTYPSFFLKKGKQVEVEIRMLARQYGRSIRSHYEVKDDLNKNIPEQKLIILEPSDSLLDLCKIRWVSKYGYNAVTDLHVSPWRWFTGKVLTGSGKIIEAKE